MLLRIKLAAFASIIIASGATETTQTVVESPSGTTELENISAAADSTHRELYGSSDDEIIRRFKCPEDQWCDTVEECLESEAVLDFEFNGVVKADPCMGGCVLKDGGKVSWVTGDPQWWKNNCAPPLFSRVCCPFKETDKPTASPTWLDDSWGGDKWDGGSSSNNNNNKWNWSGGNQWNDNKWGWSGGNQWNDSKWGWSSGSSSNNNKWNWSGGSSSNNWSGGNQWNSNNKWGWSGGSSKNDDWGGWEPSMSKWNHDGWHQDGWQDDGWNDDGHNQMGWKGDDDRARLRKCAYSDCCEAERRGRDFPLYDKFLRTQNGNGECRLRDENGRTGFKERCNKRGFCFATEENCSPSDC